MSGIWILPTKGRPAQVAQFFERWRKTAASTPGKLIINADEDVALYDQVSLPDNWCILTTTATCVADAVNQVLLTVQDKDWVGLLCDDHWPESMEWDAALLAHSKPHNLVASQNGSQEHRLHGALVYGGTLLRAVGWMYPPGIKHSFHDDAWEMIGDRCLNIVKVPEVMVRHAHAGTVDETGRKRNAYWNEDEKAWLKWRRDESNEVVKRVIALMREGGANVDAPDLGERSVLICTPCYSGSYKRGFVMSMQKTLDLLRALNIKVSWEDAPHVAEPSFARAIIHGRFVRSPHTDLVMIDDDMTWSARDLLRLLNTPYDLSGVAGPRKTEQPAFAAHISKEDAAMMLMDEAHGAMRVTNIGGAFVRITRSCAERMVAAYPEMMFEMGHGAQEHDLFNSMIVEREGQKVRLGEDFSYCERARRIGINTMALIDIRLGHVGEKEWSGALIDILKNPVIPRALEAAD